MAKNITLKLDDALLQQCKKAAFEEEKSVSQWVSEMIISNLRKKRSFSSSKAYALKKIRSFSLGGKKFSRDELHERR